MTPQEAQSIVDDWLSAQSKRIGIELGVDKDATRDEDWCWVFFYNSRAYLETGSFSEALVGNGPLVVERDSGRLHELTTARPIDEQLDELREALA
jgi:hypothetical protein